MRGVDLTGANLDGVCLQGAVLTNARTAGASFRDADLRGACLDRETAAAPALEGANFPRPDPRLLASLPEIIVAHTTWIDTSAERGRRAVLSAVHLGGQ